MVKPYMPFIAALCFMASPVHAQTPPIVTVADTQSLVEVVAGAGAHLRVSVDGQRSTSGLGLAASGAVFPHEHVGLVGEGSVFGFDSGQRTALLGGLRVRSDILNDSKERYNLFGQFLVGPQWSDPGPRRLALQAAVGIDNYLENGYVLHAEFAYRFTPFGGPNLSTGRYMIGLGIPINAWR